jgi:hypothetical protein
MRRSFFLLGLGLGLVLAGPAAGQTLADYDYEDLAFRGIGVGGGYIWADKVHNADELSIRIDLGYLGPGVRIIPSVSYWSSDFTDEELDDLANQLTQQTPATLDGQDLGTISLSDIALSVDGHFVWNTPLHVLTFAGAGLGFHALNGQGAAIDDTFVEDLLDAITLGASAIAGLEIEPVDRFRIYGEGRYTFMNSIQYLSLRAGLQLMFATGDEVQMGGAIPAPHPMAP